MKRIWFIMIAIGLIVITQTHLGIASATELPSCPATVTSISSDKCSVTINWDLSDDQPGLMLEISLDDDEKQYEAPASDGKFTITNLNKGETITIRMRAYRQNSDVYEYTEWTDPISINIQGDQAENLLSDNEKIKETSGTKAKKTVKKGVSNSASNSVMIYFDKTYIKVRKDGIYSNSWHYTSGSTVTFTSSNPSVATISRNGRTYSLKKAGTTTIKAIASKGGNTATASYTLNVTAVPFYGSKSLSFSKVRFSFGNFGSKADLNLCKVMYKSSHASRFYKSSANNGAYGNCYGMATCAGLFYGHGISPAKLKKTDKYTWTSSSGKKTTISVQNQIKAMHITCASDQNEDSWYAKSTTELMEAVKSDLSRNKMTVVYMSNNRLGAHAVSVFGYKAVDRYKDYLAIYDSYYGVKNTKYLYLYKNSDGSYNGKWKYTAASGKVYDSTVKNTLITYTTYNQYCSLWSKRGQLTFTKW